MVTTCQPIRLNIDKGSPIFYFESQSIGVRNSPSKVVLFDLKFLQSFFIIGQHENCTLPRSKNR